MEVIQDDGSPHGEKTFVFWNPPIIFLPVFIVNFLVELIASVCCKIKSLRGMWKPFQGCVHGRLFESILSLLLHIHNIIY